MEEQKYERAVWAGGLLLRDEHILMVHNCWPRACPDAWLANALGTVA
ncbi:MAG: hypothetical protein V3S14_15080 [Anaerolineae bacterium]